MTLALTSEEFSAAMREDQRSKGQRSDVSLADQRLGKLKLDFSALDINGMWPASARPGSDAVVGHGGVEFFQKLEQNLPDYVDSMLLSAVAGVAWI